MMTESEVYERLCSKDIRNPMWLDIYGNDQAEDVPEPRIDCPCDNCFYGRDELALEIIRLRLEIRKS